MVDESIRNRWNTPKIGIFDKIDFNSPIAFYIQIKETIRAAIEKKQLKPGDLIPGESELCAYFSVSRTAVRQALDDLHHEGLVVRKKGKGTFVSEPKIMERFGQKLSGFYHDMTSRGYQIKTEVLQKEILPADEELANYLSINIGKSLVMIKRLRYLKDEPIVLVSSFLPFDQCGQLMDVDLSKVSLYDFLENELGFSFNFGRRSIEAVLANSEQAKLLRINKGDPLLFLNSITYLVDGTPIEFYRSYYRGDRFRFEVELIKVKGNDQSTQFLIPKDHSLPSSEGMIKT